MKKILTALFIVISFASCKKVLIDDYKINFYTDNTAMQIFYTDVSTVIKDTLIHASTYSVSFTPFETISISASINGATSLDNLHIQIYKNDKLVKDTSATTMYLSTSYYTR